MIINKSIFARFSPFLLVFFASLFFLPYRIRFFFSLNYIMCIFSNVLKIIDGTLPRRLGMSINFCINLFGRRECMTDEHIKFFVLFHSWRCEEWKLNGSKLISEDIFDRRSINSLTNGTNGGEEKKSCSNYISKMSFEILIKNTKINENKRKNTQHSQ